MKTSTIKEYISLLAKCRMFEGIPEESYADALKYLSAERRSFKRGEFIMHIGDEAVRAGLILKGTVECSYQDAEFNKFNMNHFSEGEMFGESLACAEAVRSPMQIFAVTDCVIMFLNFRVLYDSSASYEHQMKLAVNLIRSFAGQNYFLNQKVRILSKKNLRDRIMDYFTTLTPDENGTITLPFSKTALAEFLCVNRAALSRELGRMQTDGLITMDGRIFTLLRQQ
ncbi:MAG: Crp/Fnr family transcriptional regulator [Synergistaceae bacterium]|nr:Crp/Fnr family transcriptional regulator [Synergistaceae bacterium]